MVLLIVLRHFVVEEISSVHMRDPAARLLVPIVLNGMRRLRGVVLIFPALSQSNRMRRALQEGQKWTSPSLQTGL
jgi:hypothetical protein